MRGTKAGLAVLAICSHQNFGYGSALTYAEMLGDTEGARLLQTTLTEETETDRKLPELAKSVIEVIANK
jgi:ferritin-like metal-binding protein YciE